MRKKIIVALASIGMGLGLATSVNATVGSNVATSLNSYNQYCNMFPEECWCGYRWGEYVCIPY